MASGHGVDKPDKGNHPGRQVGRNSFSDAMDIRGREYAAAEAGEMTAAQMSRVDIDPRKYPNRQAKDWRD